MSTQGPPADAKQAQAAALHEIEAAQRRKRALEVNLATIEATIWAQEASYLEETAASGGNIIKVGCGALRRGSRRGDAWRRMCDLPPTKHLVAPSLCPGLLIFQVTDGALTPGLRELPQGADGDVAPSQAERDDRGRQALLGQQHDVYPGEMMPRGR
ncbi:hypothetical protein CC85DRAFT_253033 [Cutaneotrichosporon oleaginosum]|uniref:Chromatin modification-related protein EAF6 n=1 Tax=Cutaneotrichosporon oleaginosum TaxID=879819 RepID=A0A0J0XBH9_9TREE|nr:uncharacterized protein CC85DRAFT_253033 [Cutaneotrichosporon oleaginosum]KLT38425.1 hypothetical protein CC85DRAFT_253033 [Cutaneotrichosporon oleaginosum]TXT12312.1 hypothetical protein COLE_02722 [Cutaneotrichosporon oleaginosum]